jgi:hypothetical protein
MQRQTEVRRRLVVGLAALAVFTALGSRYTSHFWTQSWFFIGLGMTASAVFLEPFFAKPQHAIVNSAGGIGAVAAVDKVPVHGLWFAFLGFLVVLLISGVAATVMSDDQGTTKWVAFRFASYLGKATIVGTSALALLVVTAAANRRADFEWLAGATAVLTAALTINWWAWFTRVARRQEVATAIAAIGPRMLLVASSSRAFHPGDGVTVETASGSIEGNIVSRLPHAHGLRYQIALAGEWTAVVDAFPGNLMLRGANASPSVVGAVGEGTTERAVDFQPFEALEIGAPVCLHPAVGRTLLYQVARERLVVSNWAGAGAVPPPVTPHVTARLIGWPEDGRLTGGTYLPTGHELVHRAGDLGGPLPDGFYEIGHVKGTRIPIGLRVDQERRGHIAVLGMSGMGKTFVAQRICRTLGATDLVIALDTTGEYATRLQFPAWAHGDFVTTGHFVYEPQGDPPVKAREFLEGCMRAGAAEYQGGATPQPRIVLLEEAHTFVPEWNFALRPQQDQVALTTRMVMQARKYGITVLMVSQRTAVVSKSALSQCENYIILKTLDQTSLEYLEGLVGPEMRDAIPGLRRFEAICVGPAFNAEEPVIVVLSSPE